MITPHIHTSAAINADFENMNFLSAKLMKMTMINIEIMVPLPNSRPLLAAVKKIPQRV
jgi:hypothetical protein